MISYAFMPYRLFKVKIRNERFAKLSQEEVANIDSEMYKQRQGRALNWSSLRSYTEKMQWEKIFNLYPLKSELTDKYRVRKWVESKIGGEYLIPIIGTWEKYSEINFNTLPNQFVMKTNHGSSDVVVIRNKNQMSPADRLRLKRIIVTSLATDYATYACEMHYSSIKPLIIAEKYISTDDGDLKDYKFLCFNGRPYYCWVDIGRYSNHKRNVYDLNWNLQNWNQFHYGNSASSIDMPENFDKMVEIAETLSEGFKHVRVDLYNVDGRIYFGELTFTNGAGFEEITPAAMDYVLGDLWMIDP